MITQFFPHTRCRFMALLVATLVASRIAAPLSRSTLRFQSRLSPSGRLRTTSPLMALGRHSYSTRSPGIGKGKRRNGGGVGYRGRAGSNRRPTAASARGRRSSFGEERFMGYDRRGARGSTWGSYDIFSGSNRSSRGRSTSGKDKGNISEHQYRTRRSGAFSAKATTSGNLLGAPPEWSYKKVDPSLLNRGHRGGNPKVNSGGRQRGVSAGATASIEADASPTVRGGRGRGSKRSAFYAGLASYDSHFASLISMELMYEKEKAYEVMASWSKKELASGRYSVQGLIGARVGRLFREHVVRFSLPPRRRDNKAREGPLRRPLMPFHRFKAGDVISITPGSTPPSFESMESGAVTEAVVLQRMPHFLDVVVKVVPDGLAESTPSGGVRMAGSACLFRLDQSVNGVSYDRMLQAVRTATAPNTLSLCPIVRGLVIDSLRPTLGRIEEVERAGGVRPGIGDATVPSGTTPPDEEWARIAMGHSNVRNPECMRGNVVQIVSGIAEQSGLSKCQTKAIRQALESRLTLIQGPPGTGKTTTACNLILAAVRLRRSKSRSDGKVMATAFSNVAADNLLEGVLNLGMRAVRIGRPATVRPTLWSATLDALVEKHPDVKAAKSWAKRLSDPDRNSGSDCESGEAGSDSDRESRATRGKGRFSPQTSKQALSELEAAQERAARDILREADVVVCSCIGAGNDAFVKAVGGDQDSGFSSLRFSTVVIDEATQATEAAALVPLVRGCHQLVLVGDQNQLPPTVLCPEAQFGGFGISLFARLMHAGLKPILLDRQYRMHPAIADFPSLHFYGGEVTSGTRANDRPTPIGFPWPSISIPIAFVSIRDNANLVDLNLVTTEKEGAVGEYDVREPAGRSQLESRRGSKGDVRSNGDVAAALGTSFCNRREAAAVAVALEMLVAGRDVEAEDVGIITPYAAQVRLLQDVVGASRRAVAAAGLSASSPVPADGEGHAGEEDAEDFSRPRSRKAGNDIGEGEKPMGRSGVPLPEIASVDGYQGREKEVILLSAVRSNRAGRVGFLADWRRLNVAITRARRGVVVVGDPDTLRSDPHWRAFLQWCGKHGTMMVESELMAASVQQPDGEAPVDLGGNGGEDCTGSELYGAGGDEAVSLASDG